MRFTVKLFGGDHYLVLESNKRLVCKCNSEADAINIAKLLNRIDSDSDLLAVLEEVVSDYNSFSDGEIDLPIFDERMSANVEDACRAINKAKEAE